MEPEVHTIPLRRRDGSVRAVTLVDPEDYKRFGDRRWCVLLACGGTRYAIRGQKIGGKHRTILLHREIMGLEHGNPLQVDHINGDTLDNRRRNLRIVTIQQQRQNIRTKPRTSRFRGVSRTAGRKSKPWAAFTQHEGRTHFLGRYATEQEAADAAAAFRREHMPYAIETG